MLDRSTSNLVRAPGYPGEPDRCVLVVDDSNYSRAPLPDRGFAVLHIEHNANHHVMTSRGKGLLLCALLLELSLDLVTGANASSPLTPQAYGASGSAQTIECNVNAGRPILTCESTADFRVNQAIRVADVRAPVGLPVPGPPSIAHSCSGAGCVATGAVSYAYAVAAVDGNGGTTQVGAESVTRDSGDLHAGGATMVFNTLTWPEVHGAVGYLIYRGLDRENIRLLDVSDAGRTTYKDYGRLPIVGTVFASAPSNSAVAGNLFSTIIAISGHSITLKDAPGISAQRAVVEHDDTAAFQRMFDGSPSKGAVVSIPQGHYNLDVCSPGAFGLPYFASLFGKNNLTIIGQGAGSVLSFEQCKPHYFGAGHIFSTEPYLASGPLYFRTAYEYQPVYAIRPAGLGASNVKLTTPVAVATRFSSGDYVYIRTGEMLGYPNTDQPDAELNRVIGSNASNGEISLEQPLGKDYAQECYPTDRAGPTTRDCAGNRATAPFGISQVTHFTTHGITIQNLTIIADAKPYVFNANQVDGVRLSHIIARVGNFFTIGDSRHIEIDHCNIVDWDGRNEGFGAKGVSDVLIRDNSFKALTTLVIQANEGSTNVMIENNQFVSSGAPAFPSWNNIIAFRNRCHNVSVRHNEFINDAGSAILRADPECERVAVSQNSFRSSRRVAAAVVPAAASVDGNILAGGLGQIVHFHNQAVH